MAAWYYLVKGRPKGPADTDFVGAEIRAGRLQAQDLLFREGDTQWRPAHSFSELQKVFTQLAADKLKAELQKSPSEDTVTSPTSQTRGTSAGTKTGVPVSGDQKWVLLTRKSSGKSGYKQRGPYTTAQIVAKLKNGEVKITDYVWSEGLKEWYKILAVPEIQEKLYDQDSKKTVVNVPVPKSTEIPIPEETNVEATVVDSILNKTRMGDGKTPPPLPKIEKKIKAVDEDQPTVIAPSPFRGAAAPPPATSTAGPGPGTVTVTKPSAAPMDDATVIAKRDEATVIANRDEATVVAAKPKDETVKKVRPGKAPDPAPAATGQRMTLWAYFIELTPVKRAAFGAGVAAAVVFLVFFTFWTSSYLDRRNARLKKPTVAQITPPKTSEVPPVLPPATPVANPVVTPAVVPQAAPPPPAPTVAEVKRAPTYIRVQKFGDGKTNPVLKVTTDASSHYFIKVQLSAEGGEVLESPSFFMKRTLRKLADREVSLADWKLPWGHYAYAVESEGQVAEGDINVGTADREWRVKIQKQRKNLVFQHNDERIAFIRLADRLARVTEKLASSADAETSGWNAFYRGWKKEFDRIKSPALDTIGENNRERYVHPAQWIDLRDLRTQVGQTAKNLNNSKVKNQDVASLSQDARAQAKEADSLKSDMIETSLYK